MADSTIDNPADEQPGVLEQVHKDESGTTTLEWALLLGVIALPAIFLFNLALNIIVGHYRMMTMLNSFPFP